MRTPKIAGSWYPNSAEEINKIIGLTPNKKLPHPSVIMLPHAGYVFSGAIAARALAQVPADEYDKVIILAPTHHVYMPKTFSVQPAEDVDTPFGVVKFSPTLHEQLSKLPGSKFVDQAHTHEHAIDIQLPLIKHYLPNCEVGALLVGQWDMATANDAELLGNFAKEFRKLLDNKTLIVISTDFTHFGKNYSYTPFADNVETRLPKLDAEMFDFFSQNDNNIWARELHRTGATICGASCMHLVLATLPATAQFKKIEYDTSATTTGSWDSVVGYTTAVINADWQEPLKELKPAPVPLMNKLSDKAGETLTKIAEYSLRTALFGKDAAGNFSIEKSIYEELQKPCGAFVTLNKHGQLRGCIGEIIANRPVLNVVYDRAISAALHDTRFSPVRAEEFGSLDIEVSVLSVPTPIDSYHDIVIGRDGVILQKDGHSAVFLPQVATEQGWDIPTMLTQLSLKAGLPADAWKTGASFQVFQAQIFHQKKDYYSI